MTTTHVFRDSLAFSESLADEPWWWDVYSQAFPTLENTVYVRKDGWAQRAGIDRLLVLADGTTLKVDEKGRRKDWPDFCIEYWSDIERRVPGWAVKEATTDYVAYAFVPSRTCYLLPFQLLRRAAIDRKDEWAGKYKRIDAKNKGYTTASLAVPIDVVLAAITDCMVIRWKQVAA